MTITLQDADYTLPAGQVLDLVRQSGILTPSAKPVSITIAGTLSIHTSPSDPEGPFNDRELDAISAGVFGDPGAAMLTIAESGVIHMDATQSQNAVAGVLILGGPAFLNQGLVDIKGAMNATGVSILDESSDFSLSTSNQGTIKVSGLGAKALGLEVETQKGGLINSGLIEVSGANSVIGLHLKGPSDVENAGSIVTHDLAAAAQSVGVLLEAPFALHSARFVNSGVISGDIALKSTISAALPPFNVTTTVVNSGTMTGEVDFGSSPNTLTNSGTITGAINFGSGFDLYDNTHGSVSGLVSGGLGNDTELGGAGLDNLQGNQGNDSLSGAGGDDIVVGGKDNDVQMGDGGDDVVWGNLGNDTLDGGDGADQVRGGQGDDSVAGGAGNDYVSGDRGNDTETGSAGADLFHSFSGAGIDRVLGFNASEGDRVMLDPGTTYTVSQVGADTVVDMGNGDQVILVGVQLSSLPSGWIFTG